MSLFKTVIQQGGSIITCDIAYLEPNLCTERDALNYAPSKHAFAKDIWPEGSVVSNCGTVYDWRRAFPSHLFHIRQFK